MPGSLQLENDYAYSDPFGTSGRSTDSKIGCKKVSFNKAVRVKQYPWNSEKELDNSEHFTLPSDRFWFKLHKNKHQSSDLNNLEKHSYQSDEWDEDTNMDCIHEPLSPITEVDYQDVDFNDASVLQERNVGQTKYLSNNSLCTLNYHPVDPPVDYFDDNHSVPNSTYVHRKELPVRDSLTTPRYNYGETSSLSTPRQSTYGISREFSDASTRNDLEASFDTGKENGAEKILERKTTQNNSPTKRGIRTLTNLNASNTRERRSRSHDDYMENDSHKQLRKADKSVSTECLDLNSNHNRFTNKFSGGCRDMATQCNGTLLRVKKGGTGLNYDHNTDIERLNSFKSPNSLRSSFNGKHYRLSGDQEHFIKKDLNVDFSKGTRSYNSYQMKKDVISSENNSRYKNSNVESKLYTGGSKGFNSTEKAAIHTPQKQNGIMRKPPIPKRDFQSHLFPQGEQRNKFFSPTKDERDTATIGYIRGRQIPLSEISNNTDRKLASRQESSSTRSMSSKAFEEKMSSPSPKRIVKSDTQLSNSLYSPKSVSCKLEYTNGRNTTHYQSAKNPPAKDNSMFDWSLSGFHLAPRPEISKSSASDSEYTVHRRPPLLMYIPGVSHHDRPAIEDDRMSLLSDLSRSEIYDGLSSLARNSTREKKLPSEMSRRYSMPRDSKARWMKGKNKG